MPSHPNSLDIKRQNFSFLSVFLASALWFMPYDLTSQMQVMGCNKGEMSKKTRARNHFLISKVGVPIE